MNHSLSHQPRHSSDIPDPSPKPTAAPDLAAGITAFHGLLESQHESSNHCHSHATSHGRALQTKASLPATLTPGRFCILSSAQYPACLTYLWTEPPPRSRLACGKTSTIIYMNDRPQFVIDAERTSLSSSPKSATASATSISGSFPTALDPTGNGPANRDTGNLAGVIVGAAIGGLLIIAILIAVIVWLCLRSRRPQHSTTRDRMDDETARGYNLQVLSTPGLSRISTLVSAAPAPAQAASGGLPGAPTEAAHYAHPPGTAL
ncbi:hypothetical protein MCOR25_008642 [Pyricularia grisea]|nr:hypothetical protein MCOR25_008642 [Pyricularia grisea]